MRISRYSELRCAISAADSTCRAICIFRSLAKLLMSTGMLLPLGFSNSSAGPPFLTARSANSVISSCGSTSNGIRFSSWFFSSAAMNSRRSLYAMGCRMPTFYYDGKSRSMTNRTAFITGASRGIGRACAIALSDAGARVVLAARNTELLEALAGELRSKGREALAVSLDLANPDSIKEAFAKAAKAFGPVTILVINAGIAKDGLALRMKKEDWDTVIATNLTGAFLAIQQVLHGMIHERWV